MWYSHLLKNLPQFVMIHTVKGFDVVNKAEVDVFLELSCFFDDPMDVDSLISGSFTHHPACVGVDEGCWWCRTGHGSVSPRGTLCWTPLLTVTLHHPRSAPSLSQR